jgi:hypothetical protein
MGSSYAPADRGTNSSVFIMPFLHNTGAGASSQLARVCSVHVRCSVCCFHAGLPKPIQTHSLSRHYCRGAATCMHVCRRGSGVQVSLPTETATCTTFLSLYIGSILELQMKSAAPKPLPLAIMTSDDTHQPTVALLKKHRYFGAKPSQVILMKQNKVACLADNAGTLAMDEEDPYHVVTKPHGHGDVHALLHRHGVAQQWAQEGFEWMAFFQDTNPLVFRGLVPSLGAVFKGHHSCCMRVPACRVLNVRNHGCNPAGARIGEFLLPLDGARWP